MYQKFSTECFIADIDRQQAVLQTTVECLIPYLPQITALLINPPYKPPVHTTCGVLKVPLGRTRLYPVPS